MFDKFKNFTDTEDDDIKSAYAARSANRYKSKSFVTPKVTRPSSRGGYVSGPL
jgi:hypothetical protein